MNNPEKTQPQLAQEINEEAIQGKPSAFQERFPVLDEEQLENIAGGTLPGCCTKPRTSSPPPQRPTNPGPSGYTDPNPLYNPNHEIRTESGRHIIDLKQAVKLTEKIIRVPK